MRAKLQVKSVTPYALPDGAVQNEKVTFAAVCGKFDGDGKSDDNTFAKCTPSADLVMTITNPDLFGKHVVDDTYYVDFTKVEPTVQPSL